MIIIRRLVPFVVLAVSACISNGRPTLRPGTDMALPSKPTGVEKKNGETCVTVKGVIVKGDALNCSDVAPDSTQRPPRVKPPQLR
jgi:hypothetical protein